MTENETTEYKKTLGQLKDGLSSIVAILNKHREGELWFGIRDDGVAVGINVGEKTIRDISQAIAAHIEPKIYPEIKTVPRDGIDCIRVRFSELLRRIQLIEGWGRGMPLILDNEPKTRFREVAGLFTTDFPRPSFEADYAAKAAAADKTGTITTTTTTTTDATTTATTQLLDIEKEILASIRQNQGITLQALAAKLNLTKDGVRYHIDNLQKRGILRRTGAYKGHWEIMS
jgi:predicted HTH transcriptional regulator